MNRSSIPPERHRARPILTLGQMDGVIAASKLSWEFTTYSYEEKGDPSISAKATTRRQLGD